MGPAGENRGHISNYTDNAKPTQKESLPGYVPTNIGANTMRGTSINLDVAKPTIREVTGANMLNPNAPRLAIDQKVYCHDIAKPTIKETTTHSVEPIGVYQSQHMYSNPMDLPKITMQETLVSVPRNTYVLPVGQQQRQPNFTDLAKTTTREQTDILPRQTFVAPSNVQGQAPLQDIMRPTTRQTTDILAHPTFIAPSNVQGQAPMQDVMRPTTRQTTDVLAHPTFVTPLNNQGQVPYQDQTRTTLREGTTYIPQSTFITPLNKQGLVQLQDIAKPTLKETTQYVPNTFIQAVGQQQRAPNLTDMARHTHKEETSQNPAMTFVTPLNRQGQVPLQDTAKSTTKESTVQNDYIGGPTNIVHGGGYGYMATGADAPNTNRQFTTQEVYVPPLLSQNLKPRDLTDISNARVSDKREVVQQYRAPTLSGDNRGPNGDNMQMYVRNDNNTNTFIKPVYSYNTQIPRPQIISTHKPIDQVPLSMFVDPHILNQLKSNPYSLPTYYPSQ
jgi:hypothetical protein